MQHSLFFYLDLKPEGPSGGVEAVRVEDKVLATQVELRRPVPEGPGGQTGPPVRHQVEGHVAGTCTRRSIEPWTSQGVLMLKPESLTRCYMLRSSQASAVHPSQPLTLKVILTVPQLVSSLASKLNSTGELGDTSGAGRYQFFLQ